MKENKRYQVRAVSRAARQVDRGLITEEEKQNGEKEKRKERKGRERTKGHKGERFREHVRLGQ